MVFGWSAGPVRGFEMGAPVSALEKSFSGVEFDFGPGAQVPLIGGNAASAPSQQLAAAAYRDGPIEPLVALEGGAGMKPPKLSLFEPNFGEAFSRAVELRLLGGGRKEVVQSFGTDPLAVVQHCLAANRIRQQRDIRLTVVMVVCGLLFLPGVLVWLAAFQLRRTLTSMQGRAGSLGSLVMGVAVVFAGLMFWRPPLTGFWAEYLRVVMLVPVGGWYIAKRICERTAVDLRDRWGGLVGGGGVNIPDFAAERPGEPGAEQVRESLRKLAQEQDSNVLFYAGSKGILGMGTRWGSWSMAEELVPVGQDIHPFRAYDVAKAIGDRLRQLDRGPLHTGGLPTPSVRHWVVIPIGEGADSISRPTGTEVEGATVKDFEIQRICNEQQFGSGNRHYLGVQFVQWDGQLVITFLITVTVLHYTLRIEVSGHALGPVNGLFSAKPAARTKTVAKTFRFWETKTVNLPLIEPSEVVRQAARAPLTWFPPVLDFLGGHLNLPEPFGLRHVWAGKPWSNRFMADDALRTATPVLRAVHSAALAVLKENGVDVERFANRSSALSGGIQEATPKKADVYDA